MNRGGLQLTGCGHFDIEKYVADKCPFFVQLKGGQDLVHNVAGTKCRALLNESVRSESRDLLRAAGSPSMSLACYKVFISHGSDDRWIASQIAKYLQDLGADTFLDETNIPKGSNFKQIIHKEIALSNELVTLFTPWSAKRSWVWIEMGAAWGLDKPVVAVFYGMGLMDLEQSGQGKGMLEDINALQLNDIERYFTEVASRIDGAKHA